jgi:ABC-2 type transport system ATP-binding protein
MTTSAVKLAEDALSAAAPPALLIDSIVKTYADTTALAGVSLEIPPGASFGLLGPNGAGKSTLIRSIVGRVRPDSGSLRIFGHAVGSSASRADIGWVPQELALYPLLTCRENLQAFGRYQGLRGKQLDDAIAWCLDWAALADRSNAPVKTLSGGMKRRLNMAAGLIHRPRLVLLDEPTVGVDPQSRNRIFEMVEALRAAGATLIYTTHYMEEAERLCDTIAIIDHGRIIALGSKQTLVAQTFGSRSSVIMHIAAPPASLAAWAAAHAGTVADGGSAVDSAVHFSIEHPSEIAALLDAAARDHLELSDVTLQRPNLESVFLHLTGKELRA